MATIFVGTSSAGAADGSSWANRLGTLNGGEDTPVTAGDIVIVGPGVFRELLTVDVSGEAPYATGTVTVTNGSAVVTGSGTTWSSNAFADGQFGVFTVAGGTDGVTDGSATFTSVTGNFQASMIGMTIRISTKGAYLISAVGSTTSITLVEVDGGTPAPSVGAALTYGVGPADVVEILSVDSDTQITLKRPWTQPTFTGVAYQVWRDIKFIADISGHLTDGVGGAVRITGSDDDLVATRANAITATSKNGRTFRGFTFDTTTAAVVTLLTSCSNWILEDCHFNPLGANASQLSIAGSGTNNTVRRCVLLGARAQNMIFTHSATTENSGHLVEACIVGFIPASNGIAMSRVGGVLIRDCLIVACENGIRVTTALATGQTTSVRNCNINSCTVGVMAITAAATNEEITENYNSFWGCNTMRTLVSTGSNSDEKPPLYEPPMLLAGLQYPWNPFALSQWSPVRALAGLGQSAVDLYGLTRPVTASKRSRGPIQFADESRETTITRTGGVALKLADAGTLLLFEVLVTAVSTTISVYVRWEADYAGTKPRMVIRQNGQADITVTATGSAGSWEQLTHTFTPAASPGWLHVFLVSSNTATTGSYAAYADDFGVS